MLKTHEQSLVPQLELGVPDGLELVFASDTEVRVSQHIKKNAVTPRNKVFPMPGLSGLDTENILG